MSLNIGGVNLFQQGLDSEYRITVLEKIIEKIINKTPGIITESELAIIRQESLTLLQTKYPQAGIKQGDK